MEMIFRELSLPKTKEIFRNNLKSAARFFSSPLKNDSKLFYRMCVAFEQIGFWTHGPICEVHISLSVGEPPNEETENHPEGFRQPTQEEIDGAFSWIFSHPDFKGNFKLLSYFENNDGREDICSRHFYSKEILLVNPKTKEMIAHERY